MKIHAAIVVVITNCEAHARLFAPILVERNAGRITNLLEGSIAVIDVKLLRRGVVDDDQIEQLIVINVNERGRESIKLFRIAHTRLDAYIFKRAVSFLMIERVTFARESTWTTHHRHAAKLAEV